jgi:hypothetical protein
VLRWARGHYFSSFLVSQLGWGLRDTAKKRHATRRAQRADQIYPNIYHNERLERDGHHTFSDSELLNDCIFNLLTLSLESTPNGPIFEVGPHSQAELDKAAIEIGMPKTGVSKRVPTLRNVFVIKLSIIAVAERKDVALGVDAGEGATIMVQFRR